MFFIYVFIGPVRLLYLVTFCWLVTVGGAPAQLSPVVTRLMERCEARETERSPGCQEFDEWPSPTATAPIQPYTHPGAALYFVLNISLSRRHQMPSTTY